jgi:hypothetical protein
MDQGFGAGAADIADSDGNALPNRVRNEATISGFASIF